ncbi:MAG: S-adenosylmethionine:tRNA ribosyltransferase-isomerase [Lewinella sp.]|nr:S-adenosylmethionine:tRNA ribosyltransferase-isomerase [Lewinella sp.]
MRRKLLHFRQGKLTDYHFTDLPELLPPATLLVGNATRVIHARLPFTTAEAGPLKFFAWSL